MIDLEAGRATQVTWPGYPVLIETDRGPIFQLLRWQPSLKKWLRVVRRKSAVVEPGIIEMTAEQFLEDFIDSSAK